MVIAEHLFDHPVDRRRVALAGPGGNVASVHILLPPMPTGSSTRSSPRSAARHVHFTVCRDGRVVAGSRSASACPTSRSSTCRSARWAAWPSRWRCGSTSRPACPARHGADAPRPPGRRLPRPAQRRRGWLIKPLDALRLRGRPTRSPAARSTPKVCRPTSRWPMVPTDAAHRDPRRPNGRGRTRHRWIAWPPLRGVAQLG
jgi:cytochrome c553